MDTDIYRINTPESLIAGNTYPGRGIIIGKSADGSKAAVAYFIMGRSVNSRNRVFTYKDRVLYTEPFDPSLVKDPSLIIYAAVRSVDNNIVVTNGNQTDTVADGIREGKTFGKALESREFEPDAPNYTPRISGILTFRDNDFTYRMSILKSIDEKGSACARFEYAYPAVPGLGHFIHTYVRDGDPIPTFQGEPERVYICDDIDEFTDSIWNALNADNKISLFTQFVDLETGHDEVRIVNKNK
ncbi:MAG: IMP cyclohydrolase [Clostridia bacterium]|nr:IMP cyclohydrolase [Clostridia bacterium]